MDVHNLTRRSLDTRELVRLGKSILKKERKEKIALSVVFVGPSKMRQLNKTYRKKDKVTNVLAFPGGKEALGEVVLCPFVIHKDALEYRISFTRAISWMFVHGLLHLLGYGHETSKDEKIMTQKEEEYLA